MRCKAGLGFWVVLNLATMVHAQQVGSPAYIAKAFANQVPRDSSNQKSDEDKANEEKAKSAVQQVKGRVVDRDGKGVANCEVTFAGPRGETRKTTDSTGSFTFEGSPGRYTITAKAGGKSKSIQAEVKDERLELPPLILE